MVARSNIKGFILQFSQRIFWAIFFIFLVFIICLTIFQYQRESFFAKEKLNTLLSAYNEQISNKYRKSHDIQVSIADFLAEIPQKDLRITIINPNGDVIFDNTHSEELENHNDRNEVKEAKLKGNAFAIRTSETTGKRYFYSANYIDGHIFRSALPYDIYLDDMLKVNKDFIYFTLIMTLLFFCVLSSFTFSIGKTISRLRDFAKEMDSNHKLDTDKYIFPNDELGEISTEIVSLYKQQLKAKEELSFEREKIIKHFQYSKEGFAMFTSESKEILSNILFIQFINVISDKQISQAEEALSVPELETIYHFVNNKIHKSASRRKVLRNSVSIDKNGKTFLIECILFIDNSFEISINDVSRQEEETRLKRQLTQNISHELKTPVSSIQGYLETILTNQDLPKEKLQFFLERCYSQSNRLTGLLHDISVLNRLDEAPYMFDLTEISIRNLISEIEKECSKQIQERHITSKINVAENVQVKGNYSLLYSIFRNLYDNAIAYAGDKIQIVIDCYKEDAKFYYFSFSDNGIGMQEEHVNRIFERFYRVDKGRSRKLGGTGLGLSIVKNAVNFHKGPISAKSSPGKGMCFFFTLKKSL